MVSRRFLARGLLALALPSSALAEVPAEGTHAPARESPEARAERLFHQAERHFDAGEIAPACQAWSESLKLAPKLGTLLNLALCHETQGKTATAWTEYHYGAAWAAQNDQKERQEFAHDHARGLERKLPRIQLQLPEDRQIAVIEIDGEPLPEPYWFLPHYLDPGDHTITVSAPGKVRRTIEVHVLAGLSAQSVPILPLDDAPLPATPRGAAPSPPAGTQRWDTRWRTVGYGTLGAGLVGIGMGSVFGIRAISLRDDIGSRCAGSACTPEGAAIRDDARTSATISTVSFAAGAVALGVGAFLVVTGKRPVPDASTRAALVPFLDPGMRAVGVRGAF